MDFFTSVERRMMFFKLSSVIAYGSMLCGIFKLNSDKTLALLLSCVTTLVLNDIFRNRIKHKEGTLKYGLSLFISLILGTYVNYRINIHVVPTYFILILIELIVLNKKISVPFFVLYVICFFTVGGYSYNFNQKYLLNTVSSFFSLFIVIFLFRNIIIEKAKTEKMYIELKTANEQIREFSKRAQELAVSKERTSIAQELHDSIGHSLMALTMNLEYAENIIDNKPDKAREVIGKSYILAKNSIKDLRKAVNVLKEKANIDSLRLSINDLFHNFKTSNKVHFKLNMDDNLEKLGVTLKDCIYKTVREGITNGIKHGYAKNFNIYIVIANSNIYLTINNDGEACKTIKKSNGLIGIENRISNARGTVEFASTSEKGFEIKAVLPIGDVFND